jgi:hypothetical protein
MARIMSDTLLVHGALCSRLSMTQLPHQSNRTNKKRGSLPQDALSITRDVFQ